MHTINGHVDDAGRPRRNYRSAQEAPPRMRVAFRALQPLPTRSCSCNTAGSRKRLSRTRGRADVPPPRRHARCVRCYKCLSTILCIRWRKLTVESSSAAQGTVQYMTHIYTQEKTTSANTVLNSEPTCDEQHSTVISVRRHQSPPDILITMIRQHNLTPWLCIVIAQVQYMYATLHLR